MTRSTASLPINIHISHTSTGTKGTSKAILVEKVVVVLSVRISTRGGAEDRATVQTFEIRRAEIGRLPDRKKKLSIFGKRDKAGGEDAGARMLVEPNKEMEFSIDFDLQSVEGGNSSVPLKTAGTALSFRTPNIEYEVSRSSLLCSISAVLSFLGLRH